MSTSPNSNGKNIKIVRRDAMTGVQTQDLKLCVWIYKGLAVSSIYPKKKTISSSIYFFKKNNAFPFIYFNNRRNNESF